MKALVVCRAMPLVLVLLVPACGGGPTSPSEEGPLRLSGSSTRAVVTSADPATLTFRLENTGPSVITLTFTSSCQLMPYIIDSRNGQFVYPSGGGWGCLTVMTQLVLPPSGVETRVVEVHARGASAPGLAAVLSPGTYLAYAQLEDQSYRLRSKSILLEVK